MADEPDSLISTMLRRLDAKTDRIIDDLGAIKRRLTSLEAAQALLHGGFAGQPARIDRIEQRLDQIELRLERIGQRLDLVPAP